MIVSWTSRAKCVGTGPRENTMEYSHVTGAPDSSRGPSTAIGCTPVRTKAQTKEIALLTKPIETNAEHADSKSVFKCA